MISKAGIATMLRYDDLGLDEFHQIFTVMKFPKRPFSKAVDIGHTHLNRIINDPTEMTYKEFEDISVFFAIEPDRLLRVIRNQAVRLNGSSH